MGGRQPASHCWLGVCLSLTQSPEVRTRALVYLVELRFGLL